MSSLRFTDPSSNLGIAGCSRMLSVRLSIAVFVLSFEPVMSAIPDSKAGPFPIKAILALRCLHQLSRRDRPPQARAPDKAGLEGEESPASPARKT